MGKTWDDLRVPLHVEIKAAIKSLNFPLMTPVQWSTIPQLLSNKDVVAEAVTGSGKTLAFLVPILQILKKRESKWKKHEIGALIVSPTRILALQIKQVLTQLLQFIPDVSVILFIGGESIDKDLNNFRRNGGTIAICTPGRLEDLLQRKTDLNLTSCLKTLEILILDEADKLLECGFKTSLDAILSHLPRQRRTGLFSATQTKQVQDLIRAGLRNPVLVSVHVKAANNTPETLCNYYTLVNPQHNNKLATLLAFVRNRNIQKALLFLPTCDTVNYWSKVLPHLQWDIPLFAIHGKMKAKRRKVVDQFRASSRGLLLCTDVMARGMDIPEVDWVVQWDPPASASAFVHRVGRTARQGHEGSSLLLLLESEEAYVTFIERNQRVSLQQIEDVSSGQVGEVCVKLQQLQLQDRDLMEKATRAFVSHIRAYSKYECSLLLKVSELPMGCLASTYGLLKLPRMPELRGAEADVEGFQRVDVDVASVPYKDKTREKSRLEKLKVYRETGCWPGKVVRRKKQSQPWELSKQRKQDRKEKRMKRKRSKGSQVELGRKKKKRKKGISEEDLKELAENISLLKKMKKEDKCRGS